MNEELEQHPSHTSPSDAIRHTTAEGQKYWTARDLSYMELSSSIQPSNHMNCSLDFRIFSNVQVF